jgi:hypothetical protein
MPKPSAQAPARRTRLLRRQTFPSSLPRLVLPALKPTTTFSSLRVVPLLLSNVESINACDATEGCIDISMSGTACYMKQKLNKPLANKGIRGARKIKNAPLSSSSSTSFSTSHSTSYSITVAPTYSEPTASTAPVTASLPTVDQGKEYINYTNVAGYFLQDLDSTVPSTFDYVSSPEKLVSSSFTDNIPDGNKLRPHQPNLPNRLNLL